MPSFFEKLKKGMGIEGPEEEIEKEEEVEKIKEKPPKKRRVTPGIKSEEKSLEVKVEKIELEKSPKESKLSTEQEEIKMAEAPPQPEKPSPEKEEVPVEKEEKKWFETEGELAIDVYQTEKDLVIQSAIAGVKPEDLDISMERDVLTIQGVRQKPFEEEGDYLTQECYWGPFSREIILPVEVDPDRVEATMKNGILTIRIPKILREKRRRIKVRI